MRRVFWVAAAIFILDQATKIYILTVIDLDVLLGPVTVIPGVFHLQMAWNYGINFGLFANSSDTMRWVLIAVALAISALVVWWMRRETRPIAHISAGLLVGGALGNVIDRVLYGAVADFLNVTCCGINNPYSFNVADISIFIGAAGLVLFTGDARKTA